MVVSSAFFALPLALALMASKVEAHGFLESPRGRSYRAHQDGSAWQVGPGIIAKEYCWSCLNTNAGLCGMSPTADYDDWVDTTGTAIPWSAEVTWEQGQNVTIDFGMTAFHFGHIEIHACPLGRNATQDCLDAYPLEFLEDLLWGVPPDLAYPERGHLGAKHETYKMTFKLPDDLYGDEVLLQWHYITGNSCKPPGYDDFFLGNTNPQGEVLPESWWMRNLDIYCKLPYPSDGNVDNAGSPEQFWNCAEVSIRGDGRSSELAPSSAPSTSVPLSLPPSDSTMPSVEPSPMPAGTPSGSPSTMPSVEPMSAGTPSASPSTMPSVSTRPAACCSQDYKNCVDWCGTTEAECAQCWGSVWLLDGDRSQDVCLSRYNECGGEDKPPCCGGLVCQGETTWWSQCTPAT